MSATDFQQYEKRETLLGKIRQATSWISIVVGSLSLVVLLNHALGDGLSGVLTNLAVAYASTVQFLFGPVEKLIDDQFALGLEIVPRWKYFFVLLWLCMLPRARVAWREGYRVTGTVIAIWGLVCAFVASVIAAAAPVDQYPDGSTLNLGYHMMAAVVPVVVLSIFFVGTWAYGRIVFAGRELEREEWLPPIRVTLMALAIAYVMAGYPVTLDISDNLPDFIRNLSELGLVLVVLGVLIVAIGDIVGAWMEEVLPEYAAQAPGYRYGVEVIAILVGGFCYFALQAAESFVVGG